MRKALSAALALTVLAVIVQSTMLLSAGCRRTPPITNLPPGVTQEEVSRWYSAVGALKVIGDVTKQATQAVVDINRQGAFPDGPEYAATLTALGRVAQTGVQAANYLETVPNTWDQSVGQQIQVHMNQVKLALQEATRNGLLGIRNDASKQQFTDLTNRIANAVNLVFSLIQVVTGENLKGSARFIVSLEGRETWQSSRTYWMALTKHPVFSL